MQGVTAPAVLILLSLAPGSDLLSGLLLSLVHMSGGGEEQEGQCMISPGCTDSSYAHAKALWSECPLSVPSLCQLQLQKLEFGIPPPVRLNTWRLERNSGYLAFVDVASEDQKPNIQTSPPPTEPFWCGPTVSSCNSKQKLSFLDFASSLNFGQI